MIDCPSCKSQAFVGTFFCMDCGGALVEIPIRTSDDQKEYYGPSAQKDLDFDVSELEALEEDARFGLRAATTGKVISFKGRTNFTLGQAVAGQAVVPDVDLSAFDAEAHGISRIHIELRVEGSTIMVVDLDSSNGTMVNGLPLDPQEPVRLHDGDVLQLGTLQMQFLIRKES
jgi:hypothetical protein